MKIFFKPLALKLLVLIFWSLGFSGISWSSSKYYSQDAYSQVNNQDSPKDKLRKPGNDSLAIIYCDKKSPYFTNLDPDNGQLQVDRNAIMKFRVVDENVTVDNWDTSGVNLDSIFIYIKTRFWEVDSIAPTYIEIIDSNFIIDCQYIPDQPFDWTDTVRVHLVAYDTSFFKNRGTKDYEFYTEKDLFAPNLTPLYPLPEMNEVPIDSGITIHGTDVGRGVELKNIKLWINNVDVLPDTIIGDPWNFKISYVPDQGWSYGDTIHVYCTANDLDANAATLQYWFIIEPEPDKTPPSITVIRPKPDTPDVPVNTDVVLYVTDDSSGVDTSSVELKVNGEIVFHKYIDFRYDGTGDTIKYAPSSPFAYQSEVSVDFYVADVAGNPAEMSYSFWTEDSTIGGDDVIPPEIEVIRPKPDTPDVSVNTDIVLYVTDDSSGVDTSSVELKVNGEIIFHKYIDFRYDGTGDTIKYTPSSPFAYQSEVSVDFYVADSANNPAEMSYSFWTEDSPIGGDDLIPPVVFDHDPAIYGSINALEYSINFKITDDSGVNRQSISVSYAVNNGQFTSLGYQTDGLDKVAVICDDLAFNYNDTVFVKIYAEDKQGNHTDTTGQDSTVCYYFIVPQDFEPPRVVLIDPTQLESVQDSFIVRIEDNLSGVDIENSEMYLWSRKRPSQDKIDLLSYIKFNDLKNVDVEYWPCDPYEYNDKLSLKFFLQDKCGNSTTVTFLDTIYTPRLLPDLFVLNFISSAGDEAVKLNTSVSLEAYIICVNEDCPDSFAVCFYFDEAEVPFHTAWIKGLTKEEFHLLNTSHVITSEGNHKVTVIVDCIPTEGSVTEENEFNNTAEVIIIGGGAKLIVRSNPFTPNDDGFNDEVEFNFEQFQIENPNLKIFDMHGKKVREFDKPNNKRFMWNGLDSSGRTLLPGIYLYILSDRNKAIARGCIVIAR